MNQVPPRYSDPRPVAAGIDAVAIGVDASHQSAVSWSAIFAGAAGAAALSLILVILGAGLGLSSVSPFTGLGADAGALGTSTIVWLAVTQLLASGMGGYLAGRLRKRWAGTHGDEVYFRDTAHGFLAWAIASLATAVMLTTAIGAIVGTGARTGAALGGGAAASLGVAAPLAAGQGVGAGSNEGRLTYFVDAMFRGSPDRSGGATPALNSASQAAGSAVPETTTTSSGQAVLPGTAAAAPSTGSDEGSISAATSAEVAAIMAHAIAQGSLPADDTRHIASLIAARQGMPQADAERRVADTFAKVQAELDQQKAKFLENTEAARKATSHALLWMFIALLAGAFVASLFATLGGRQRDL